MSHLLKKSLIKNFFCSDHFLKKNLSCAKLHFHGRTIWNNYHRFPFLTSLYYDVNVRHRNVDTNNLIPFHIVTCELTASFLWCYFPKLTTFSIYVLKIVKNKCEFRLSTSCSFACFKSCFKVSKSYRISWEQKKLQLGFIAHLWKVLQKTINTINFVA